MSARLVIGIAFAGFVALGLPEGATGVAWPSIADEFGRPIGQLGLLIAALVVGYSVAAGFIGPITDRVGLGWALVGSSAASTVGLFGMALAPTWPMVVVAMAVLGAGGGVVDAGLNAHVALERGARVMHLLHASFGVGATIGPALMTLFVVGSTSWRWGFGAIGVVQLGLGVLYLRTRTAWGAPEPPVPGRRRVDGAVVLSLAVFAVYTGLEVAAGQWAFSVLSEGRGVSAGAAGLAVTGFWGALTLGRLVAGAAGERWRPGATLSAGLALSVLGTVLFWWAPVMWVGAVGLLVVGLGLAPIFPMLTLLTPMRVGRERSTTVIGYQLTAASIGAVALPGGIGWLVGRSGLEVVAPVLVGAAVVLVVLVGWSGRASVATP